VQLQYRFHNVTLAINCQWLAGA